MAKREQSTIRIDTADYRIIQSFEENVAGMGNAEFLHVVAEHIELLRPYCPGGTATSPVCPGEAATAPMNVYTSAFPSLFPTASWSLEDRKRFLDVITRDRDEYGYTAPLHIKRAFDEQKLIPYDYDGDPKIKTKFGYYTRRFLDEHPYLIAPDWFCWQAGKLQLHPVIFPEMDNPETDKKVLLEFYKDPVIGTLLFRKVQIEDEKRRKEKQDGEFPPERDGIRIIQK